MRLGTTIIFNPRRSAPLNLKPTWEKSSERIHRKELGMRLLSPPRSIFGVFHSLARSQPAVAREQLMGIDAAGCDFLLAAKTHEWENLGSNIKITMHLARVGNTSPCVPIKGKIRRGSLRGVEGYISGAAQVRGWVARRGPTHLLSRASQHVFRSREWKFLTIYTWESARLSSGCLDTRSVLAEIFASRTGRPPGIPLTRLLPDI